MCQLSYRDLSVCSTLYSEFGLAQRCARRVLSHTYVRSRVRHRGLGDLQTSIRQHCENSSWYDTKAKDVITDTLCFVTYCLYTQRHALLTCGGDIDALLLPSDGRSGRASGPAG